MDQGRQAGDEDLRKSIRVRGNHNAPFTEAGYTDATGIVSRSISLLLGGLSASVELRVRR